MKAQTRGAAIEQEKQGLIDISEMCMLCESHVLSPMMLQEHYFGQEGLSQGWFIHVGGKNFTPPDPIVHSYVVSQCQDMINSHVQKWLIPSSERMFRIIRELADYIQQFVQVLSSYKPVLLASKSDKALFSPRLDQEVRQAIDNLNDLADLRDYDLTEETDESVYTLDMLNNLENDCNQKIEDGGKGLSPDVIERMLSLESHNSVRGKDKKFIPLAKRILRSLHEAFLESCRGHTYPVLSEKNTGHTSIAHPTFWAYDAFDDGFLENKVIAIGQNSFWRQTGMTEFREARNPSDRNGVIEIMLYLGYFPNLIKEAYYELQTRWKNRELKKKQFTEFVSEKIPVYESRIEGKSFNAFKVTPENENVLTRILHSYASIDQQNMPNMNEYDEYGVFIGKDRRYRGLIRKSPTNGGSMLLPLAAVGVAGFIGYKLF
jgi:hypothetical protein